MADHSDWKRNGEEEEEEEEEAKDEFDYKAQKDALLFAIHVSKSMLELPPASDDRKADKDSSLLAALKSAHKVMQQRIISNPKDMMGILLFGTEMNEFLGPDGKPSTLNYPHCYVYTPLDVPSAEDVKKLKALCDGEDDSEEILTPSSEGVQVVDMLFCAIQIFTTKAPNFGSRRLFIITDDDCPNPNDAKSIEAPRTRAKDLFDLGITINLFPITRGEQKFDLTRFYGDVIYRDPNAEVTQPDRFEESKSGNGRTIFGSLLNNINSKQTPKRAYFSNMPLELGPGLTISVKGYNVIQKQEPARSCYIWLDGEKAQMAGSETTRLADDTTRTVDKGELKKAYKFGGEYVYFSPEEQKNVKDFGDPCIRIIGFKDRSLLRFWMAIRKSIFIFPSEEGFVGSTRVFTALWQKLLKSNKVGIAWHVPRKNGNPSLVAVIPSRSKDDDTSGTWYLPAGLWLYPIPYADDIRPPPDTKLVRTTDELTNKMNKIVRQLQLPKAAYDPEKYPNPALQWHYKILQALALEEEVPDEPEDATKPKTKAIHKRCGGYIEEWSAVADEELLKHQERVAIKRAVEDDDEDEPRPAKRVRKTASSSKGANEDGGSALDDVTLKKKAKSGELSKLKVADLKHVLVVRSLETTGKKADLVERLEEWVDENL
ncbi:ku70 protein [Xylariales sp. AK1849]|nr:ku70 protein [Xylariales sp. AK1849]